MYRHWSSSQWILAACIVFALGYVAAAEDKPAPIDWNRARQIYERFNKGETLNADERTYLERAKQAKARGAAPSDPRLKPPAATSRTGLVPLDQMAASDRYKGEDGGLYGGGKNVPPPEHQKAADRELAKIAPLDAHGKPDPGGKIVLLSLGMSNTTQEFSRFKELADRDPGKSPQVVVVDGAQGGQDAERWSDRDGMPWRTVEARLKAAGVTAEQVQAVWVKHARIGPARFGEFPKHTEELKGHIRASLQLAKQRFPNLRVAYLSSRIYAGYATTPLNPEPFAYESAFAVRGLIRDQVRDEAKLNDDAKGPIDVPWLLWGPYLWADGLTPRKTDGLVWTRDDLAADGTHPSGNAGRDKVARLLLKFFKTDPNAKGWFGKPNGEKWGARCRQDRHRAC